MSTDPTFALSMAVVTAAIWLIALHLVDMNEKEPVWAVGLLLLLGAGAGVALARTVDDGSDETLLGEALASQAATLSAIVVGLGVFEVLRRRRGWAELNGLIDGIVYGGAAGLGVALGGIFVDEIDGTALAERLADQTGPSTLVAEAMRLMISHGLFGAIVGAGFGAIYEVRRRFWRMALPATAAIAALLVHYCYLALTEGDALDGLPLRPAIALLLPFVVLVIGVYYGLRREQEALAELEGEDGDIVSEEDLSSLRSPGSMRAAYLRSFRSGDLESWQGLRELRNRQLQLALAKHAASETGAELSAVTEPLRQSIRELRQRVEAAAVREIPRGRQPGPLPPPPRKLG